MKFIKQPARSQLFNKLTKALTLFSLAYICTTAVQAKPLTFSVSTGTPVLPAEQSNTAIIKVSLTGYDLPKVKRSRAPVNVAIVLDRSGSMSGQKLNQAKDAAITALDFLGAQDVISIISYDDRVRVDMPATKATDKSAIRRAIQNIRAGGNTALFAGVSKGSQEVGKFLTDNRVNRVILLSDGIANVGPATAWELGELGQSLSREGIAVSTIGLGLGYNEDLMVELAKQSDGNHVFAERATDLAHIFRSEFNDVTSVVAQNIDINIFCADGVKPLRILGRDADIVNNRVSTRLNQVYSQQEKYLLLEVQVPEGKNQQRRQIASVDVSYTDIINNENHRAKDDLWVSYSRSEKAVRSAYDKATLGEAVKQRANYLSKEAVQLRDAGRVQAARKKLEQASMLIQEEAEQYDLSSEAFAPAAAAYEEDAARVEDEASWNKNRKGLREKQYKLESQQRK